MKFDGWQIPFATIAGVFAVSACTNSQAKSEVIAAWVQGIGSLVAIGVAVWIYAKQYADKRADDLAETVAFVQAMRHEIQVIWDEYEDIRTTLRNTPAAGFFSAVVPLGTDSLIVYSHTPDRVGKIDDEALRALIVRTYTGLRGHLNSLRQNNALIEDYEQFYTMHKDDDRLTLQQRKTSIMQEYTAGLKRADEELETLVKQFLADTEAWTRSKQKQAG
ncbi:hypothetical protein ACT2FY_32310 [Paraburkholderia fungorum]|uniref:hypothetical protein n=1 Tax=Paraburkholderia fungorum TaxID=134537 RepID=UPI00402B3E6D